MPRILIPAFTVALIVSCNEGDSDTKPRSAAEPNAAVEGAAAANSSPAPDVEIATVEVPIIEPAVIEQVLAREGITVPEPDLVVGKKAPPLEISSWIHRNPGKIEKGKITIVETWATWCKPCIQAIPNLSSLADTYSGQGLVVVAVNVEADNRETVAKFVKKNASRFRYSVAHDDSDRMLETWIKAAALPGLPATFLVDRDGRIAWLGHPSSLGRAVTMLVAGTWNAEEERRFNQYTRLATPYAERAAKLLESNTERAYQLIEVLLASVLREQPKQLAGLAYHILAAPTVARRDLEVAYRAGALASQLMEWREPRMIELISTIRETQGQQDAALTLQRRAVAAAGGDPRYAERLAKLEATRKLDR